MFGYEDFGLSLSFHFIYLVFAFFLLSGYTFFTYRYTITPVAKILKIILITLRTSSLLLLLLILFEPSLSLTKKEDIKPSNFVFIDNSRSITIDDQTNRVENTLKIAEELSTGTKERNLSFYTFGGDVREIETDSLKTIRFNEGTTNIANIFSTIEKDKVNISSTQAAGNYENIITFIAIPSF